LRQPCTYAIIRKIIRSKHATVRRQTVGEKSYEERVNTRHSDKKRAHMQCGGRAEHTPQWEDTWHSA
jgi:hypothetical protein